jgi:4a-hydroxytetrahydrobiopterin dehydratase
LTDDDIEARLARLDGWARAGNAIAKTWRFADFREALGFVSRVARPADEQDHHPDVAIQWNEVTLTLWTHASGGLTERDFRLATTIDQLET